MARCKLCKTNVPDGTEYCTDCLDKDYSKFDESYLDGLLNSIKNDAPTTEAIYSKKDKNATTEDLINDSDTLFASETLFDSDAEIDDLYKFDVDEIEVLDQTNLTEELSDDINNDYDIEADELFANISLDILEDENMDQLHEENKQDEPMNNEEEIQESGVNDFMTDNLNIDELNNQFVNEYDQDLNELLSSLNSAENDNNEYIDNLEDTYEKNHDMFMNQDDNSADIFNTDNEDRASNSEETEIEDDFLSLLGQMSSDDPVADDVRAISDLINGVETKPQDGADYPSDVGEVFSDALKAVSNLTDPDSEDKPNDEKKPKKKKSKEKIRKSKKKEKVQEESQEADPSPKKQKKGFMKRLFGNVEDESAKKPLTNSVTTEDNTAATKEATQSKKSKKVKKAKKVAATSQDNAAAQDGSNTDEKNNVKENAKKEKKAKVKKVKEVIQVIDEIEEDEGRINRVGAFIVFAFFGLLTVVLIVGSNALTYTLSIKYAKNYFEEQEYTRAYNEVYGMTIKAEDIVIYDRIRTVMYVNKQLNSYHNYTSIGDYPQALDSLLKGLKRYDKYIELAKLLDIKTDMDYVRDQLLVELDTVFNLSEKEALKINLIEDMEDYSIKVYELAYDNEDRIQTLSEGM